MKVLVVGDIVGRPGRNTLQVFLEKYKDRIEQAFSDLNFVQMKKQNEWLSFVYERKI